MRSIDIPAKIRTRIAEGTVIPAIPLALDAKRHFDPLHQRALVRYYMDAGVGGLAVGVHTTQFAIREPRYGLYRPVLEAVSGWIDEHAARKGVAVAKVGGVLGKTAQARAEAEFLVGAGYHAGLLSMSALKNESIDELIDHAKTIASIIPVIGFYLQPDVGGRILPYEFWRRFAQIENVIAIKMAPFNRYRTIDVVRGVCDSGRADNVALYTGNDDNIVLDLLAEYRFGQPGKAVSARIVGGLLGHWCIWTKKAVEMHAALRQLALSGKPIPAEMLTLAQEVTDANAVVFDAANGFKGCIPGIHEVLRRQGLLAGTWCLDPSETMSPGQAEEIDRIYSDYPHLVDDDFVRANLGDWLA